MGWTQRQHPRFKASLPIELRPKGGNTPLRAQTADLCLGGCYVEMMFTQEVSTTVDITLWIGEQKIVTTGEVVSKHPSFGNGVKFTRMKDEDQQQLVQFLQSLKSFGQSMPGPSLPAI